MHHQSVRCREPFARDPRIGVGHFVDPMLMACLLILLSGAYSASPPLLRVSFPVLTISRSCSVVGWDGARRCTHVSVRGKSRSWSHRGRSLGSRGLVWSAGLYSPLDRVVLKRGYRIHGQPTHQRVFILGWPTLCPPPEEGGLLGPAPPIALSLKVNRAENSFLISLQFSHTFL